MSYVDDDALAGVVQRVFTDRESTLLAEGARLRSEALADRCMTLRAEMVNCVQRLRHEAFEATPGREPGEPEWTAGEIISHNSDRMLWALDEAAHTAQADRSAWPPAPDIVLRNAACEPHLLDHDLALSVIQAASSRVQTSLPVLLAADSGQTSARTHHGEMSVTSWLLLLCIHDWDHLGQLRSRHTPLPGN